MLEAPFQSIFSYFKLVNRGARSRLGGVYKQRNTFVLISFFFFFDHWIFADVVAVIL